MRESPRARAALGAGGIGLLVLASVAATLLAVDVLRWERALDRGDAAYAASARTASWSTGTTLPAGLGRSLLGLDDDLAYRRALQRFWQSDPRAPVRRFEDVTRRSAAERDVATVSDTDGDPARRAQMLVLRGALLLEEARSSPVQREVFARRAIEQFKKAATLDPAAADAVYDLELALKLLRRTGSEQGGGGDARSPSPDSGAGAASSGSGL